jgi:Rps23 Pro-64 3,4-dihydroxylase Tpa1-like proline 4-hydroxylase
MSSIAHENIVDRQAMADQILAKIAPQKAALMTEFQQEGRIQSCFIDHLLPEHLARRIFAAYPDPGSMMLRKSLREFKHVAAQMDQYDPLLEEIIYAFQDPRLVLLIGEITGIPGLIPDEHLYAGGISLMSRDHFLNPHLDNSHDKDRNLYRVLNLLYYVTPDWSHESGGNLELWDNGPQDKPREVVSRFNRLVLMATHRTSWHSVNKVLATHAPRCCVSNYYFSATPLESHEYFHVTTFRGRPEEPVRDVLLKSDAALRTGLRKVFKKGVTKPVHVYDKAPRTDKKI